MEILLKENEKIEELGFKQLKIIQNKNGFCFGIDAVLLSDFAKQIKVGAKVLDLGTGTGIIATLLCGKTQLSHITGIEIQKEVAEMAKRSIKLNHLEDKFDILEENILKITQIYPPETFDAIVTNPPYQKKDTGIVNCKQEKVISRHEITASLHDFIKVSKQLLKDKGELYMVHRTDRLVDIFQEMRENKIEPKQVRFICPAPQKAPNLVLIKGVKNAKPFLKLENNLYVYDENGNETEDIKKIYQR